MSSMWFIGVEVKQESRVHPLLKKILDPPLSSRFNTTVGNDGDHCNKNHLWFNRGWMFGKIRHCTRNGYDLQTWISSLSYTKFGIEIDQWQKRAVTWEVRKVQMVLNFPTVALLNTWMVLVHLQKNEDLMFLKHCDWIIFFQVPWYK